MLMLYTLAEDGSTITLLAIVGRAGTTPEKSGVSLFSFQSETFTLSFISEPEMIALPFSS